MKRRHFLAGGLASSLGGAQRPDDWARQPKVGNRIANACDPVRYTGQRIDSISCLGRRFDANFRTGLLQTLDVDDYLRGYGEKPRMPPGEYLGKFLQGLARMYLCTGDAAARLRADKIVQTWLRVQSADGWLGSYQRFRSWDVWEHKYVLLGLMDYYALTGENAALRAADRIGGLLLRHLGPGLGSIVQSGHWALGSASILEAMVSLYRYTGEPKYLRFCEYILRELEGPAGPKLIRTLTTGSRRVCDVQDTWANRAAREVRFNASGQVRNRSKGYEMLSCLIGLARMYQLTGRHELLSATVNAWQDISANRLYLAGSSGADECFKDDQCLPAESSDGPAEACVTAHWIYLNRVLFEITGAPRYADALEIALYNYLFASQRPQDCHQSYNTPMNGVKTFARHTIWSGKFPCCISSTMREIARLPESVWTKFTSGGVGVLLYCQAAMEDTIRAAGGPLALRMEMRTVYPASGEVTLQVQPARPQTFRLALRVPIWTKSFVASADNNTYRGVPGGFLDIERRWSPGDTVKISMDLNERLIPGGASYPGHFAFMRGPQVLTLVATGDSQTALPPVKVSAKSGPALVPAGEVLPDGWVNDQAYRSAALKGAEGCVLVPFGDAGQPGASREFRTWIPVEPGTAIALPAAPSGLRVRVGTPYRIDLEWEHAGDGDGIRVERKRLDVGLWFHVKTTRAGVNRCQDDAVNVVLPGHTYSYRVCAFNASGASAYSEEVTVTTPALAPPPAPSELRAVAVSASQINLSWKSGSNNHEGFRIERKDVPQGPWQLAAGRIPPGLTTFHDIALEPGREYRYRVQAFHSNGQSDWTPEWSVRTPSSGGRE